MKELAMKISTGLWFVAPADAGHQEY